jgi:DNA mismatch repair protein MLH3
LFDATNTAAWVPLEASAPGVSIIGCVCLTPFASKRLQFLSIGIEPLTNDSRSNILFEEINLAFASSSFGVIEDADGPGTPGDIPKFKDTKPRRGIDRWPIFSLQVSLQSQVNKPALEDLLDGRAPILTVLIELLRIMCYEFLKKHHFRPRPVKAFLGPELSESESPVPPDGVTPELPLTPSLGSGRKESPGPKPTQARRYYNGGSRGGKSTAASTRARPSSPFDFWSRVKMGRPSTLHKPDASDTTDPAGADVPSDSIIILPTLPLSKKLEEPPCSRPEDQMPERETVDWINPISKIRSTIDARTSFVIHSSPVTKTRVSNPPRSKSPDRQEPKSNSWITEVYSKWDNTAFGPPAEPRIPRIARCRDEVLQQTGGDVTWAGLDSVTLDGSMDISSRKTQGRISRQALQDADIIGQVDSKYILAKIHLDSPVDRGDQSSYMSRPVLVVIDQHAADERCRVEQLMKSYFTSDRAHSGDCIAQSEVLEKTIVFELPIQEIDLLSDFREHFTYWGILYEIQATDADDSAGLGQQSRQVAVQSLPPSILERCRLEPHRLENILRKEIWRLADEATSAVSTNGKPLEDREASEWIRRFHNCPQGIQEMINSRACRSEYLQA